MSFQIPIDLSRCALHTQTIRSWSLAQCIEGCRRVGFGGISVWRDVIRATGAVEAGRMLRSAGLHVPALVRGGFFPAADPAARAAAIEDNRRCIEDAAEIGAEMVVLVVGAVPGMPLSEARRQTAEGIGSLLDHARGAGVRLAIEPLHPMYAADRSCINRMADARRICLELNHPQLGIAVDVYHVWWDPDLEAEIDLAGRRGILFGFHVCDWRPRMRNLLTDRGVPGDGCIDIRAIRSRVEQTGFNGYNEVEVFSDEYWATDPSEYLERIARSCRDHV